MQARQKAEAYVEASISFQASWNHVKTTINVCLNAFIRGHFPFQILICHRHFQDKAKLRKLNLGGRLIKVSGDNREPS